MMRDNLGRSPRANPLACPTRIPNQLVRAEHLVVRDPLPIRYVPLILTPPTVLCVPNTSSTAPLSSTARTDTQEAGGQ